MPVPITSLFSLPVQTFLQVIGDENLRIAYSQLGEDFSVYHLLMAHLPRIERGFYVDVGAFHPRKYSNTRILSMLGWRGLNVDASEENIANFKRERPNDINICTGIGKEDGKLVYYQFSDGAVSTLSPEVARTWQEKNGWKLARTGMVKVRRLDDVLREFLPSDITAIDYMNIDIEGLDEAAVFALDLERLRPKILSVEIHNADLLNAGQNRTVRHLADNGYRLMAVNVMTFTFLDTRVAVNL